MSIRFDWDRATRQEYAIELLRRNVKRRTTKDSAIPCGVCGAKHIVRHNYAYYPSIGLSKDNKVIGHADCVERVASGEKARLDSDKRAHVAKTATNGGKIVLAPAGVSAGSAELVAELERLQGWREGVKFAMGEPSSNSDSAAFLAGWRDGVMFVQSHKAS